MWASLYQHADCETVITTGATAVLYLEGLCYLAVRVSERPVQMLVLHVWWLDVSLLFTRTRRALVLILCCRAFLKESKQRSLRFLFVLEKQKIDLKEGRRETQGARQVHSSLSRHGGLIEELGSGK